jgi:hypothetical protein
MRDFVAVRCGCIIHRLKIWYSVNQGGQRPFAAHISNGSKAHKDETALAVLVLVVGVAC